MVRHENGGGVMTPAGAPATPVELASSAATRSTARARSAREHADALLFARHIRATSGSLTSVIYLLI
jgi:hypothetical protein